MNQIKLKIAFFFLILVFSLNTVKSNDIIQNDSVQKYVYQGFGQLYNFEFNQCVRTIIYLKEKHPESPWTYVLATNYYWWKYLTGEEKEITIKKFYYNLKKVMDYKDNVSENESKFCLALSTAFKSRLDVMEGKYLTAMRDLMKEINIISSTLEQETTYKGYYLTSGLYYYLNAAAYRDYFFLRPFLILVPKGDLEKGIKYLKYDKKDIILNTESEYFILKLYSEIEKDYNSALIYGKKLTEKYPQNILFRHILYKTYQNASSQSISNGTVLKLVSLINHNRELTINQKKYLLNLVNKNYKV